MTPDELILKVEEKGKHSLDTLKYNENGKQDINQVYSALSAVLKHLKDWRDWETRWKGHMSMTILADEERNAKYRLVQELSAIIEKELG